MANNYPWGQSDKKATKLLLDFKIQADAVLHRQIWPHADVLDFDDLPQRASIKRLLQECATRMANPSP